MTSGAPFRWCFIGTGGLAHTVAWQIARSGRHEIASVFTRRADACEKFAQRYGAVAASSAEEAISAPNVDGVYVVTPHSSHFEYAKRALELGKPVLCEKPVTVNAAQAAELIALSEERGVYFSEAMWTWFSPVAHQVKRWLDEGEFGDIEKVVATYRMNARNSKGRLTDPARAGGALLDIGVYPITYLYRLFGNPVDVRCEGIVEGGIDLSEKVSLTFSNGATYTAIVSMDSLLTFNRLVLKGSRASTSMLFFHAANRAVLRRKGRKNMVFSADGSYVNEFDHVAEEIRAGLIESPLVPHSATLDVLRIMDECRKQIGLVYPFERVDA